MHSISIFSLDNQAKYTWGMYSKYVFHNIMERKSIKTVFLMSYYGYLSINYVDRVSLGYDLFFVSSSFVIY